MTLRQRLLLALLPLIAGLLFACGGQPTEALPQREVVLELRGLDCGGCAESVRSSLARVAGVSSVTVDHEALSARVRCSESTQAEALVQAVRGAGEKFSAKVRAD
jgi:copper chaperone CopZ